MYQRAEAAFVSVLAVLIAVLVLSGCGGSDKKSSGTGTTTSAQPAQMKQFADCMRKQGLDQQGEKQTAQTAEKMQQAFQQCSKYMPKSSPGAAPSGTTSSAGGTK